MSDRMVNLEVLRSHSGSLIRDELSAHSSASVSSEDSTAASGASSRHSAYEVVSSLVDSSYPSTERETNVVGVIAEGSARESSSTVIHCSGRSGGGGSGGKRKIDGGGSEDVTSADTFKTIDIAISPEVEGGDGPRFKKRKSAEPVISPHAVRSESANQRSLIWDCLGEYEGIVSELIFPKDENESKDDDSIVKVDEIETETTASHITDQASNAKNNGIKTQAKTPVRRVIRFDLIKEWKMRCETAELKLYELESKNNELELKNQELEHNAEREVQRRLAVEVSRLEQEWDERSKIGRARMEARLRSELEQRLAAQWVAKHAELVSNEVAREKARWEEEARTREAKSKREWEEAFLMGMGDNIERAASAACASSVSSSTIAGELGVDVAPSAPRDRLLGGPEQKEGRFKDEERLEASSSTYLPMALRGSFGGPSKANEELRSDATEENKGGDKEADGGTADEASVQSSVESRMGGEVEAVTIDVDRSGGHGNSDITPSMKDSSLDKIVLFEKKKGESTVGENNVEEDKDSVNISRKEEMTTDRSTGNGKNDQESEYEYISANFTVDTNERTENGAHYPEIVERGDNSLGKLIAQDVQVAGAPTTPSADVEQQEKGSDQTEASDDAGILPRGSTPQRVVTTRANLNRTGDSNKNLGKKVELASTEGAIKGKGDNGAKRADRGNDEPLPQGSEPNEVEGGVQSNRSLAPPGDDASEAGDWGDEKDTDRPAPPRSAPEDSSPSESHRRSEEMPSEHHSRQRPPPRSPPQQQRQPQQMHPRREEEHQPPSTPQQQQPRRPVPFRAIRKAFSRTTGMHGMLTRRAVR